MLRIVGLAHNLKANRAALIYKFFIIKRLYEIILSGNMSVGVYFDYGSGLEQKGRSNLENMINKACSGAIDYILTKSISRFSKNVLNTTINYHIQKVFSDSL